jgi:predicted MFS family arabinose efflux permease
MTNEQKSGARTALALLLAINLFNYIDRYVLASVLPTLKHEFLAGDPNQNGKAGLWTTAFLISYMFTAPIFGWLADRFSRWILIGTSVAIWSLASGWSGLATSFAVLLCTRLFVGIGEAYAFGGKIADLLGWRWAFYLVVPPGLFLAACCFFMREPRAASAAKGPPRLRDYRGLFRIRSYVLNTAAMTVMTFAIGGFSAWMPDYIFLDRRAEFPASQNLLGNIDLTFGGITAAAGLLATLFGGWAGDKLRERFASSYFLVSGMGMLLCVPATIAVIYVRFPMAWLMIFIAVFFLFFNTGPSNTALANVTPPTVRASAFALNIFIIHLLGDATSPPLIGVVRDRWNMNVALWGVAVLMIVAGVLWFWGAKYLPADTEAIEGVADRRST